MFFNANCNDLFLFACFCPHVEKTTPNYKSFTNELAVIAISRQLLNGAIKVIYKVDNSKD